MRVRVIRDGGETYRGSFVRHARVRLGTTAIAPFQVTVERLAKEGHRLGGITLNDGDSRGSVKTTTRGTGSGQRHRPP